MHPFLMASTLGDSGSVPVLPVELRHRIWLHVMHPPAPPLLSLSCAVCGARVLYILPDGECSYVNSHYAIWGDTPRCCDCVG